MTPLTEGVAVAVGSLVGCRKSYEKVEITPDNLETFADHPPFSSARIFDLHPPGKTRRSFFSCRETPPQALGCLPKRQDEFGAQES